MRTPEGPRPDKRDSVCGTGGPVGLNLEQFKKQEAKAPKPNVTKVTTTYKIDLKAAAKEQAALLEAALKAKNKAAAGGWQQYYS